MFDVVSYKDREHLCRMSVQNVGIYVAFSNF